MTQAQTMFVVDAAKRHAVGGRNTAMSLSSEDRLATKRSLPGSSGCGTNPEQLLGAARSACFERVARTKRIPALEMAIEPDLHATDEAYFIGLNVNLPTSSAALRRT
jgi:lipoyl-dependent peroxiredoxin